MNDNTLGFIGLGNMGTALLKGFMASEASENIYVFGYDVFPPNCEMLETYGAEKLEGEEEIALKCKYILLAVKPQSVEGVLKKIRWALTEDSVIISICAGISADYIKKITRKNTKVVQVMPNTPMLLGQGASAISYDADVSEAELFFVISVIECCSPVVEFIPKSKMNEIIAINGSSPAFVYYFAQCFLDYAAKQNIETEPALKLFSQTLIGAAHMLSTGTPPDKLIEQVSSKGGTTVAGLEELRKNGFDKAIKAACNACTQRAYELGEERK